MTCQIDDVIRDTILMRWQHVVFGFFFFFEKLQLLFCSCVFLVGWLCFFGFSRVTGLVFCSEAGLVVLCVQIK